MRYLKILRLAVPTLILFLTWGQWDYGRANTPDARVQLQQIINGSKGNVALAAKNLRTGELIEINAREEVQTASVIKLPIMVEAFYQAQEGRTPLDSLLLLDKANLVQGSGILQDLSDGLILPLRDALTLMIALSDNTATNMVIDSVGIDAVNSRMERLGLVHTRLFKKVFLPPPKPSEEQKKFGLGVTTPADMLKLLEMLARGDLVDKASSEAMISILKKQRDRDQIPRYISYDDLGENASGIQVANKTGALDRVRNDVGLVFTRRGTYLMAIFTWNSADARWTPDNAATLTIAQLARVLFEHFEKAGATP
ncbi:MAG: class A beta-lactamase-related serine hydrolase [Acidobacteriia bacterium]|nr:class A beta-lactamase-related serine hydrolase [Terriglobia bacterium]